jgi:CheY-like chemotaxis protein
VRRITIDMAQGAELQNLRSGTYMLLTVSDNGSGMDQATLDHVFDPFFTTKRPGEGTGLGLAIVQGIVSSHNGELRVRSTVGSGTTFDLYFPVCTDPLPEPTLTTKNVSYGRMEEILVVDDEPSIGAVIGTRLKQLHYLPAVFQDPVMALETFRASPSRFKAVITDLTMPSMTGLDLLQAIRQVADSLPVIVMTGYSQDTVSAKLNALPHCIVMQKPVDGDDIARILGDLLSKHRSAASKSD